MNEKPVAVVTGASSGIGEAIAHRLTTHGFRVFGASRGTPSEADGEIEYRKIDVGARGRCQAHLQSRGLTVGRSWAQTDLRRSCPVM
jgi:NAD(P)-dependent dehydrogenase (short-subunit alcohol dehydrogenase family)